MYPHERSLVKKLAGKPFALIGVNSDSDLEELKPVLEEENIIWRSFWNGPEGTSGPISKAWNVRGWPTIYVIDHEGKIAYKSLGSNAKEMDAAIEKCLVAMGHEVDLSAEEEEDSEDSEKADVAEEKKAEGGEKPSAEKKKGGDKGE